MKEFYDNLKSKRVERGLTLEDIHRKTRLPLMYLNAIEAGDVEALPEGYERIYLRRYARELGLDEDEILRDFDLLSGRRRPSPSTATPTAGDSPDSHSFGDTPDSNGEDAFLDNLNLDKIHRIFWITLAGLTILLSVYFVYDHYSDNQTNGNVEIREVTITDLLASTRKAEEIDDQPPIVVDSAAVVLQTAVTRENAPIRMELVGLDSTWVREIRDQRDTTEYILTSGVKRSTYAGQSLRFLVGRAQNVRFYFNGADAGIPGEVGQVASLTYTIEGLARRSVKTVAN